jgi:HlyD family secretion protein
VRAKISELSERKISAEYELDHIDIRSPQTGRVHQLEVHTVGGVIKPGETIMLIVPDNDALSVEAKISPADIDQISLGQTAVVRFSAFNQRTTPEVFGTVKLIAADLTEDQRSGAFYYLVRVIVPPEQIARLKGLKLIPGMPGEVFIQTGSRTLLSYMFKPLTDQITRTFREAE